MKRLLSVCLAVVVLLSMGCAGQSSAASSSSGVEMSASDGVPSDSSAVSEFSEASPNSLPEAPSQAISTSEPNALPVSAENGALAGQALAQITKAAFADEERFLLSEPATKSWSKAYESFYDAYPLIAQYTLEPFHGTELRDKFAYTFWSISPANISDIYCSLSDSPSPPANLFSKFFMRDSDRLGILLNYAGTDRFLGEGQVELWASLETGASQKPEIVSAQLFEVGRYSGRSSLTMTAGIEAQLLEQGFSPETTVAYALSIPDYAHGVCFIDGENISFYVASDSLETPQSVRLGVVYPFMLIAQDIHDRIDEIDPMTNNPGISVPPPIPAAPLDRPVPPLDYESVRSSGARADRYFSDGPATLSWRVAYERFYSGGVMMTPALVDTVWQGRYDHFDYATHADTGAVILRSDAGIDFVYPMLEMPFAAIEEIIANGPTGDNVKKLAQNNGYYGFLASYKADNSVAGEGEVLLPQDGGPPEARRFVGFHQGDYDGRSSMTITEGIEAQLLDYGFSPETTGAFSLTFNKNYYGVCFYDDAKSVYYNSSVTSSNILKPQIYSFEALAHRLKHIRGVDSVRDLPDDLRPPYDALPEPEAPAANPTTAKPVIYLYPEQTTDVTVTLGYPNEQLTYTYPTYEGGWRVRADPDGRLTNLKDGSTHYYLFWEGGKKIDWHLSEGFVIKSSETEAFLREKLAFMGLTPREYNDFITYWVPEMSQNPYNLISFSTEQYEALAPLSISPAPDSMLRVHMVYKGLSQPVKVQSQTLVPWQRTGFAAVEWGGSRA